jgi:phosphohistidine phosphatase SixA
METLILVRHGHDIDDRISALGTGEMNALCDRLAHTVQSGGSVLILSSVTQRAQDSADVLAKRFGAPVETFEVLWSENAHPENMAGALALIREHERRADILMVVTHHEYVKDFPAYYGREELGVTFPSKLIDKGRAWIISKTDKRIQCV